jgi:hypothetical protein
MPLGLSQDPILLHISSFACNHKDGVASVKRCFTQQKIVLFILKRTRLLAAFLQRRRCTRDGRIGSREQSDQMSLGKMVQNVSSANATQN